MCVCVCVCVCACACACACVCVCACACVCVCSRSLMAAYSSAVLLMFGNDLSLSPPGQFLTVEWKNIFRLFGSQIGIIDLLTVSMACLLDAITVVSKSTLKNKQIF